MLVSFSVRDSLPCCLRKSRKRISSDFLSDISVQVRNYLLLSSSSCLCVSIYQKRRYSDRRKPLLCSLHTSIIRRRVSIVHVSSKIGAARLLLTRINDEVVSVSKASRIIVVAETNERLEESEHYGRSAVELELAVLEVQDTQ